MRKQLLPAKLVERQTEVTKAMKSLLERLRTRRLASAFILLAVLSAAIVGGSFAAHGVRGQEKQSDSSDATPLKIVNSTVQPSEFARIAKQVAPAVVNINTETLPKQSTTRSQRNRNRSQQNNGEDNGEDNGQSDNDMQDFFNRFFGQNPFSGGTDGSNQVQESLGSGFIVDSKGYIVTNYHVVEKADKIYVKLSTDPVNTDNGRPAHVIGADKSTDLAVIKIDADKPLPTVKLGDSEAVQVGDWVEAIGSPFALSQTITAGIISAKNRTIEPGTSGQFQHFLQTDAAINPGNSGGPLVDMNGNVIGVNTAIYTQSNGYQGVGFALPSNTIVSVYNQLIGASHKVVRGSIGIQFRSGLSDAVNRVYGFKNGVLVQKVQAGGPADKAGMKSGDIITTIDGREIKDGDELVNEIANRKPDSTVRLGYLRDGKPAETAVTIGDRDKVFAETASNQGSGAPENETEAAESKLGIAVRDLPSSIAGKIQTSGVLIESVRSGSFADLQGLEPGLVITHLNRQPTTSREQFNAAASKLKTGNDVVLEVIDPNNLDNGVNYVAGTLQ
jgi:serine protease Do